MNYSIERLMFVLELDWKYFIQMYVLEEDFRGFLNSRYNDSRK